MNKLIDEVRKFREAFVIAVGDQSPFAKVALGRLDAALEEEESSRNLSQAARVTSGDDILDPIREAVYYVKQKGFDVVKIHITQDFKMRVRAKIKPVSINMRELMAETILGYPVEVHKEAEKDWWIEDNTSRWVKP